MTKEMVMKTMKQIADFSPMQAESVVNGINEGDLKNLAAMAAELGGWEKLAAKIPEMYNVLENPDQSILELNGDLRNGIAALLMGATAACRIRGLDVGI